MNPYDVLGVPRDADDAAIKAAWRAESLRWHPDRCSDPDAPRRFAAAKDAYELLRDPARRAACDRGESPGEETVLVSGLEGVFSRAKGRAPTERERTGLRMFEFAFKLWSGLR